MINWKKQNKVSDEVFHGTDDLIQIDAMDMDHLIRGASLSNQHKIRYCAHQDTQENIHEMFIVHQCGYYVRPHKHPNKIESMLVLKGEVDFVVFNKDGSVKKVTQMANMNSGKVFYNSLRESIYHTLLIRSEWLVFLEITTGPFDRKDTKFSKWSPSGENHYEVKNYLSELENNITNEILSP